MAVINSIDMREQDVVAHIVLSRDEYSQLNQNSKEILVLPADIASLKLKLTTGKLGNGNRIMFPTSLLKKHGMEALPKKVPSSIFYLEEDKFLLVKLKETKPGIPVFPEDWKWKR